MISPTLISILYVLKHAVKLKIFSFVPLFSCLNQRPKFAATDVWCDKKSKSKRVNCTHCALSDRGDWARLFSCHFWRRRSTWKLWRFEFLIYSTLQSLDHFLHYKLYEKPIWFDSNLTHRWIQSLTYKASETSVVTYR